MPLTERELLTKFQYDESAEAWLSKSGGRRRPCFWDLEMKRFEHRLPKKARVVEIGCGPATDGKYLKAAGFDVTSFDYSRTMLTIAKEMDSKAKLLQMNAYNLGFPKNSFDGFWATASLLHLERPQDAIKEIVRVTKDKGTGFVSVKDGEGDGIDPKSGYYFKYHTSEGFKEILKNCGFEIINAAKRPGTPSHDWLTYLVRVNK